MKTEIKKNIMVLRSNLEKYKGIRHLSFSQKVIVGDLKRMIAELESEVK